MAQEAKKLDLSNETERKDSIHKRFRDLYEQQGGDIEVSLANGKKRRVHSLIMTEYTDYFKSALSATWKEGAEKSVSFLDMNEATADAIFRYVYNKDVLEAKTYEPGELNLMLDVAEAADKLLLVEYKDFILHNLSAPSKEKYFLLILFVLNKRNNPLFEEFRWKLIFQATQYIKRHSYGDFCKDNNQYTQKVKYCCMHKNVGAHVFRKDKWGNDTNDMISKESACKADSHHIDCCSLSKILISDVVLRSFKKETHNAILVALLL